MLTGPASQRHRLALLALLADAPGHTLARQTLLGLLWPESDTASARQLLNVAVSALRRELGSEALRSEGDALRLEQVEVDLVEFERAIATGAPARALEWYRGPFLDGFSLPEARAFEEWQENRRARLARAHATLHEELADEAEARADAAAAVEWWRRRLALTPGEGRVALRLMRALEAAGDRAGALQVARIHEALLREEFEAEPDAAVRDLALQLRNDGGSGSPPPIAVRERSGSQRPLAARPPARPTHGRPTRWAAGGLLVVAVAVSWPLLASIAGGDAVGPLQADVETRDELPVLVILPPRLAGPLTEHETLAFAIASEVYYRFGQMRSIRVAGRPATLSALPPLFTAADVARASRADYILEIALSGTGQGVRVFASLVDARTGAELWPQRFDVRATVDSATATAARLAREIARTAGVVIASSEEEVLARPYSSNRLAIDHFVRGRPLIESTAHSDVIAGFSHMLAAIAADSAFALPYAMASIAAHWLTVVTTGPEPTRLDLQGLRPYEFARRMAMKAQALDPRPAIVQVAAGNALYRAGPQHWDAAERALARAVQAEPNSVLARISYADFLSHARGRTQVALTHFHEAAALDPLSAYTRAFLVWGLFMDRRFDLAVLAADSALAEFPDDWTIPWIASLSSAHGGRPAEGWRWLGLAERRASRPLFRDTRALLHALSGQPDSARALLTEIEGVPGAIVLWHLGEQDSALQILDALFTAERPPVQFANNPNFAALRSDPRVAALLARAGLTAGCVTERC